LLAHKKVNVYYISGGLLIFNSVLLFLVIQRRHYTFIFLTVVIYALSCTKYTHKILASTSVLTLIPFISSKSIAIANNYLSTSMSKFLFKYRRVYLSTHIDYQHQLYSTQIYRYFSNDISLLCHG